VTREQREAWIDQLNAENAASLAEIAMREARTMRGEDPQEWKAPGGDNVTSSDHRGSSGCGRAAGAAPGDLVFKDFISSERQHAPRLELRDVFDPLALRVLQKAFRIERGHVKQRQTEALSQLNARLAVLEGAVAAIEQRLAELESADNEGSGYEG
jgi:hypothetical protein